MKPPIPLLPRLSAKIKLIVPSTIEHNALSSVELPAPIDIDYNTNKQ
jgi:hypothetical protein